MADEETENPEKRSKVSRRSFLKAAAAGAAGVGAVMAAPTAVQVVTDFPRLANGGGGEPLMAYVQNPGSGEIVVMLGTKEVVLRDFGLVSRLFGIMGA